MSNSQRPAAAVPAKGADTDERVRALESAAAQRDAMVELVGILVHDLSNPLQSITVLCELGFDASTPASEEQQRFDQMLVAADRMRALIHGFAGLARGRGGRSSVIGVVDRAATLLQRRFERYRCTLSRALTIGGETTAPEEFEYCLITALLGVIAGADEGQHPAYELSLVTEADEGRLFVRIEAWANPSGGAPVPVRIPEAYVSRCIAAACQAVTVHPIPGGVRLNLGSLGT